jgi:hypothetical protein
VDELWQLTLRNLLNAFALLGVFAAIFLSEAELDRRWGIGDKVTL